MRSLAESITTHLRWQVRQCLPDLPSTQFWCGAWQPCSLSSIESTRICTLENLCALNINIKCANARSLLLNRSQSPWHNAAFCHRSAAYFWVSVLILPDGIYPPILSHKVRTSALLIGQPLLPSTLGKPFFPFRPYFLFKCQSCQWMPAPQSPLLMMSLTEAGFQTLLKKCVHAYRKIEGQSQSQLSLPANHFVCFSWPFLFVKERSESKGHRLGAETCISSFAFEVYCLLSDLLHMLLSAQRFSQQLSTSFKSSFGTHL